MDVATLTAVAIVGLTVALGGASTSLKRRSDRWRGLFTARFWLRWAAWTIVLTAAGILGIVAGGGGMAVHPVIATGIASLIFAVAMWIDAR